MACADRLAACHIIQQVYRNEFFHIFPEEWAFDSYKNLLFGSDTVAQFPQWFWNTFIIACFTCIISTAFVLMVAYATSCMRFRGRKTLMNIAVIINLFPGVLAMIAVYFIL